MVLLNFLFRSGMQPQLLVMPVKTFRCRCAQTHRQTVATCDVQYTNHLSWVVAPSAAAPRPDASRSPEMRERVNTSCLSACIRSLTCIIRRRHPTGLDVGTRADDRYTSCAGTCRFSASRRSCAVLASPRPMTCQCVTNGFGSKTVIAGRGFCEIQFISVFWQGNKNAPLACRWTTLEKIKYLHIIRWWCYANLCRSSSCVLI